MFLHATRGTIGLEMRDPGSVLDMVNKAFKARFRACDGRWTDEL